MADEFDAVFSAFPPEISEYTFTNLYAWRESYRFAVCRFRRHVLIRTLSPEGISPVFFPPVGPEPAVIVSEVLRARQGYFIRIPEAVARVIEQNRVIKVIEDRDNADYLYSVSALIELAGRRYDGKRNLIRNFQRNYQAEYVRLNGTDSDEVSAFEERWCADKHCDEVTGLSQERRALREMFLHFSRFHLCAGGIRIGGVLCALAVGQRLNPQTLVVHILKADAGKEGLYQAMVQEFLRREAGDVPLVNLEQDLGIPGLRQAKQSYHPVGFVRKYRLEFSGE
ncbi:MAG: phosphatidylglycerol lysyltransferase domain-containing protein [Candidatus Omnitrophica bacterium]|nr:phosphatidylglycerol lysyltransferase domain-containing protein [Candidatus Omnitrophota bacterium]